MHLSLPAIGSNLHFKVLMSQVFLHIRSFIMPAVLSPLQSSCHSLPHTAFFSISFPLYSEHFISPCHLSFLSVSFHYSRELFYPSNQDPKTLAFKSLTVSAFLSDGLDLNISFLSHLASVSFSLCLFSINLPPVLLPLLHFLLCLGSPSQSHTLPLYA